MGALATAYDVGAYPFLTTADAYPQWVHEVESWLADRADWVAGQIRYQMALIGHEVSGHCYATDLARDGIPETRYIGYMWPEDGHFKYFESNADIRANTR